MIMSKGAIGNLANMYRAVLKKCHLVNVFGSLAVASMLVMGGSGVTGDEKQDEYYYRMYDLFDEGVSFDAASKIATVTASFMYKF